MLLNLKRAIFLSALIVSAGGTCGVAASTLPRGQFGPPVVVTAFPGTTVVATVPAARPRDVVSAQAFLYRFDRRSASSFGGGASSDRSRASARAPQRERFSVRLKTRLQSVGDASVGVLMNVGSQLQEGRQTGYLQLKWRLRPGCRPTSEELESDVTSMLTPDSEETHRGVKQHSMASTKSQRCLRAQVFPLTINVTEPSPDIIPEDTSSPSSDRIVTTPDGVTLVRDELDIGFSFRTPLEEANARIIDIARATSGVIIGSIPDQRAYQVQYEVASVSALREIQAGIKATYPDVETLAPNYIMQAQLAPTETSYQTSQKDYYDSINAEQAWTAVSDGSPPLLRTPVAVIDCGFPDNHPDLQANIEFIRNQNGTSLTTAPACPQSGRHGTRVAGALAAIGNNASGGAGMAWPMQQPILRLYHFPANNASRETVFDLAKALNRVVDDNAARIVVIAHAYPTAVGTCSAPSTPPASIPEDENSELAKAMLHAAENDVLVVNAAGNQCLQASYFWPAKYSLDPQFALDVLTVGATDADRDIWRSQPGRPFGGSNFGSAVEIAAPGVDVYTTEGTAGYTITRGTSLAAPITAGVAALILGQHPDWPAWRLKQCIVGSATVSAGNNTGTGRTPINVLDALAAVNCSLPASLPKRLDIVLSLDLTGSMDAEIANVAANITKIVTDIQTAAGTASDVRFAVVSYQDHPAAPPQNGCRGSAYSQPYGVGSDVPYRRDLALTKNASQVVSTVTSLASQIGNGGDRPQSYARVFWEVAQDALDSRNSAQFMDELNELDFRRDSVKFLINFGDDVPHDTDLNGDGLTGGLAKYTLSPRPTPSFDTGVDPGRDLQVNCVFANQGTASPTTTDIDFQEDALASLEKAGVRLIHIDSSGIDLYRTYWQTWTAGTGGTYTAIEPNGELPSGFDLSNFIIDVMKNSLQ